MIRILTSLLLAGLLAIAAPKADAGDPRIRYVDYDPDQVLRVVAHTGFQTTIEFQPDETISNVAVGDAGGWQITANAGASLLFLKPVDVAAPTNLTVVTSRRSYNFELHARSGAGVSIRDVTFSVRFRRKEAEKEKEPRGPEPLILAAPPELWNRAYTYEGSAANVPDEVFDNGRATFFRWDGDAPTPAIFVISDEAGESVVNFSVQGRYVVVEHVAAEFVLRRGKEITYLFNDSFVARAPGPDAPPARDKKRRKKKKRSKS